MGILNEGTNLKRLIVLVPDVLADNIDLAHKVHWMAIRERRDVLYLTLVDDDEQLLEVSRNMATMKAVTSGSWLVVNSTLTATDSWLKTLGEIHKPGDMIVCHQEQLVKDGFLRTRPLSEFLRSKFHAPVAVLSGYYHPRQVQMRHWLAGLLFWTGFFALLVLFGFLEIRLSLGAQGLARTLLLVFVMVSELGAIWAWNSFTNH